jgi:hypothetical protein
MRRRIVIVNDKMQQGYRYMLRVPAGRDFDPHFRTDLTPKQMLELGVFCGKYLTDCRDEFPASWFVHARLAPAGRDCSLNYFGVDASQPLSEWRGRGWIHPDDPRGWFQWYCRYYMGRRMREEDAHGRSNVGRPCSVTSRKLEGIASRVTFCAAGASVRPCCTGLTTAARFSVAYLAACDLHMFRLH